MVVASSANMADAKTLGLDLEGIWWMSDNPIPEELVSFAFATLNSTTFPVNLAVPAGRAGQWSWLSDIRGNFFRRYQSYVNPFSVTNFTFASPLNGMISNDLGSTPLVWVKDGQFPMYKYTADCDKTAGGKRACNPTKCASTSTANTTCTQLIAQYPDDMWSRPTVFDKDKWAKNKIPCPWAPISNWRKPWWPDVTYTLKRIILADGSPHPIFWKEWLEHTRSADGTPGAKVLQSFVTNDWCRRIKAAEGIHNLATLAGTLNHAGARPPKCP